MALQPHHWPRWGVLALVTGGLISPAEAGWPGKGRGKCAPCCPPVLMGEVIVDEAMADPRPIAEDAAAPAQLGSQQPGPQAATPQAAAPQAEPALEPLGPDFGSSSMDVASSGFASAPNMVGDFLSIGGLYFLGYNAVSGSVSAANGAPLAGGRRIKIGESTSPMPRDRVYFTYNLFRDAYTTQGVGGGIAPPGGFPAGGESVPGTLPPSPVAGTGTRSFDAHRFTFGVEKTFLDGWMSVDVRIPFSRTLSSTILVTNANLPGEDANEFDNISVTVKGLLYQSRTFAASAGLSTSVPTADDIVLEQQFNDFSSPETVAAVPVTSSLRIRNQSVHLLPYVGGLWTPNQRLFVQGFAQFDFPVNGNETNFRFIDPTGTFTQNNSLYDQSIFQIDLAAGYWLFRKPCGWLRGIAPIIEGHYTTTITDADLIQIQGPSASYRGLIGNTLNRLDIVNLTLASTAQIGERGFFTTGFVIPVRNTENTALFDWEFLVQLNYQFGAGTRAPIASSPIF